MRANKGEMITTLWKCDESSWATRGGIQKHIDLPAPVGMKTTESRCEKQRERQERKRKQKENPKKEKGKG